jgi:hypothetical protein
MVSSSTIDSSSDSGIDIHSPDGLWACIDWCKDCPEVLQMAQVGSGSGPSGWASNLFRFFAARLATADSSIVAHYMLEIISFLALRDNAQLLDDALKLSWTALHTVYNESPEADSFDICPYAQRQAVERLASKGSSSYVNILRRVVEATVVKLSERPSFTRKFAAHRQGLLRHWGLLTHSTRLLARFSSHLAELVDELGYLLGTVGAAVHDEQPGRNEGSLINQRPHSKPSLPCLDAATFPDYFETLAVMILGAMAVVEPVDEGRTTMAVSNGPYHHVKKLLHIFRRLVDLYRKDFHLFPQKTTPVVFRLTRDMLAVTIAQMHQCAEWRNSQPLLSVAERKAGAYDAGAISYFQELLDSMASHTVGTALALCEFCVDGEGGLEFPFKRTSLRFAAEKAERAMKDSALVHNLPVPSSRLPLSNDLTSQEDNPKPTKGFPRSSPSQRRTSEIESDDDWIEADNSALQGISTRLAKSEMDDALESDAGSDVDDASFGVAGDWGDCSKDDDSSGSLDLKTSLLVRST